jgi:hypothetical protein
MAANVMAMKANNAIGAINNGNISSWRNGVMKVCK